MSSVEMRASVPRGREDDADDLVVHDLDTDSADELAEKQQQAARKKKKTGTKKKKKNNKPAAVETPAVSRRAIVEVEDDDVKLNLDSSDSDSDGNDDDDENENKSSAKHSFWRRTKSKPSEPRSMALFAKNDTFVTNSPEGVRIMVSSFGQHVSNLKFFVNVLCALALLGIALEVTAREIEWAYGMRRVVAILRLFHSGVTIVLIYTLYRYFAEDWALETLSRVFMSRFRHWDSRRLMLFFVEVIIVAVHTPPFFDGSGSTIDISVTNGPRARLPHPWGIWVFMRLYLVFRLIKNHYYEASSKLLGIWNNFDFGLGFVMRHLVYSHPFRVLIPLLCSMAFLGSYVMLICEREAEGTVIPNLSTAAWLTFITIEAVGYGDIFPVTTCGRTVAIVATLLSIMMTAMVVATLYQNLTLLPHESRMVEFLESTRTARYLRVLAATVLQRAVRVHLAQRRGITDGLWLARRRMHLGDAIYNFQAFRRRFMTDTSTMNQAQFVRRLIERQQEGIQALYDKLVTHPEAEHAGTGFLGTGGRGRSISSNLGGAAPGARSPQTIHRRVASQEAVGAGRGGAASAAEIQQLNARMNRMEQQLARIAKAVGASGKKQK